MTFAHLLAQTTTFKQCHECIKTSSNRKMPLRSTEFPSRPWQRVAMDLFFNNNWWLIVTDYYSRYPELARLEKLTSGTVVNRCKSIFTRHGIPEVVVSDNGPQFSSYDFQRFAQDYGFTHNTSSPHYPQSNGLAEAAVKTVKPSMKKTEDLYLTLLSYRSTPLKNGYSPSELLMGRRLRAKLPATPGMLVPHLQDVTELRSFEEHREQQR